MKKYEFTDIGPMQKKINCSIAAVGSLGLLYGVTGSIPICNTVALLGGAVVYRCLIDKTFTFNRLIKNNLYQLIKYNNFYKKENDNLTYKPLIYYDYDDKNLIIKVRIDGSNFRDNYLDLENSLEDLFVMECIDKTQDNGYITYKLDKTSTERLNISNIDILEKDIIAINNKIRWNYRKCPHALIAGVTGKGKTYLLAYLIKIFILLNADIKILDPKMSDLSYLEKIFRDDVVSTPGQIAKVLRETTNLMNERYQTFKSMHNYGFGKDYKDYGFKPIFIVFDEIAAFMASIDKKTSKEIDDYMSEIIMKGRQAGVFMVLTTQRPDSDVIKTAIRDQLGLRVALGEMSKTGYSMVFGSEFNDLELNNAAPGNGYIFIDGVHTKPVKFQSPLFEKNYNFVRDLRDLTRRG